jgi:Ser/Thr protein kinase RdoA (MazF antagonist)
MGGELAVGGEVGAALSAVLTGAGMRIRSLERRPSPYRSSYPLEELDVALDDGSTVQIVFKDLARSGLDADARRVKPAFLYEPLREIAVYERLLEPARLGTARLYGSAVAPEQGRYWLFIERVDGAELYQIGELALWEDTARWLAGAHLALTPEAQGGIDRAHLVEHDRDHYLRWMERALRFATSGGSGKASRELTALARHYPGVADLLAGLPRTVIHGELYASNVLISRAPQPRVCPVDWEMAGVGPGLVDLAALTTGALGTERRGAIVGAYRSACADHLSDESFGASLAACRLHLAVQWLGWAADWRPPPDHRHDWFGEAKRAARELGL